MTPISESVDLSKMTDDEILSFLCANKIDLKLDEAKKVQEILGRAPSLTELIIWGIQGSEHCSYRSSRRFLKTLPVTAPNVMLGVGEDSGIAEFATDAKEKNGE